MEQKIIIGDCTKVLKKLPSRSVQLVVTSPPYNIGKGDDNWKDRLPSGEYLELTKTWLKECYRILDNGGKICVNLPLNDNRNITFIHYSLMIKLGFKFKTNIIWIKWDWQRKEKFAVSKWRLEKCKFHSHIEPYLINVYEIILVMQKGHSNSSQCPQELTYKEFEEWKYNAWLIPPLKNRKHPAPYPVELPKRLIKLYTSTGQTVLDPFLGSGTTIKASKELNRSSIGIESNREYVEMAKQRITA